MTLTIRWASGAVDDLESGARWYDERQSGLGAQFAAEVLATATAASARPLVLKRYEHSDLPPDAEFRKIQLHRFNEYGVIYTVIGETFWVLAVAHAKRKPAYWIARAERVT